MAQNIAQTKEDSKKIPLRISLPVQTHDRLKVFKQANGLSSLAVAAVKIIEARLYPAVNGDA